MSDETTGQMTVAEEIVQNLKAEVEQLRSEKTDAVAEQWVEITNGRCRVAVCNSTYGLHYEIGPLHGSKPKSTKVFAGSDKDSAIALLLRYMHS